MCLAFLLVYGATMRLTMTRTDIGTWAYAWERRLPFVPIFIVPYMSIDAFFVGAPFLCATRRELSRLSRRVVLGIVVAGLFFLFMPLRFAFERPTTTGPLGGVFDWFRAMDGPFNLFPSLHIVLRTILAEHYARHARGWLRQVVTVWFSLIGASTLLVYQHHVVDVIGGFGLAALCFYVFPDRPASRAMSPNRRVGFYYLFVATLCFAGAVTIRSWCLWLLWPAASCGIVASAYFGLGPAVYRKANGRLSFATRLWLAPVLAGQWLSLRHYARRSNAWDALTDRVWIGRALSRREVARLHAAGVRSVVDLTCEFSAAPAACERRYLSVPVLDLTAPTPAQLDKAVRFIACHARRGIVYVHCKAGYSRTAAVAACYLVHARIVDTPDDAFALLRAKRPGIVIRPEIRACVESFANRRHEPRP